MLMPQDQVRSINGLTEDIYNSLENIGIKYVLQLVTMTRSQILCIKGIFDVELSIIYQALHAEGLELAVRPLEYHIAPIGPRGLPANADHGEYDPSRDPKLNNVQMGIHTNESMGVVEFVFPVPMLKVQLRPHNAIAVANIITQKAQSLLFMDELASDKIM